MGRLGLLDDAQRVLADLVIRSQLGDMGAFADLVRRFERMVWGYAFSRVGDFHRSADVAQETCAAPYLHLRELEDPTRFAAWLRTVARTQADRETRRRRVRIVSFDEDRHAPDERSLPASEAERRETVGELHRIIRSLPDKQRVAASLCYVDGCSVGEIAEFLGVSEGTARKRLFDARRSIARLYPKEDVVNTEKMLRGLFDQHLSPDMVRRVMENPALVELRGESRELTTLFIDVIGCLDAFAGLPPQAFVAQLNEYFTAVRSVVLDHGGFMDKCIGDEVMAFWGAPLAASDHAVRACAAALELQRTLARLSEGWAQAGRPQLRAGVGVNTGVVVIGNFGPPERLEYTPMGDAVNVAARMERETRRYGVDVVVSEHTARQAGGRLDVRELGVIETKAPPGRLRVYELRGVRAS